jgi:hypothetical protein
VVPVPLHLCCSLITAVIVIMCLFRCQIVYPFFVLVAFSVVVLTSWSAANIFFQFFSVRTAIWHCYQLHSTSASTLGGFATKLRFIFLLLLLFVIVSWFFHGYCALHFTYCRCSTQLIASTIALL